MMLYCKTDETTFTKFPGKLRIYSCRVVPLRIYAWNT